MTSFRNLKKSLLFLSIYFYIIDYPVNLKIMHRIIALSLNAIGKPLGLPQL